MIITGALPVIAAIVRGGAIGAGITLCMLLIAAPASSASSASVRWSRKQSSQLGAGKRASLVSVTTPKRLRAYALAAAGVALAAALGALLGEHVTIADQAMLFLPAILVAAFGGRGPSLAAAALSVAAFDFFFVPPRFTFVVSDARSLITFAVMFGIGSASGTLVARLRCGRSCKSRARTPDCRAARVHARRGRRDGDRRDPDSRRDTRPRDARPRRDRRAADRAAAARSPS